MPPIEKIKDEQVSLRFWLGICVASLIALIAWIVEKGEKVITNFDYKEYQSMVFMLAIAIALVLLYFITSISKIIKRNADKLEKL